MLDAGAEGLARFLEAPLVKAEFSAPAWPSVRAVRWAVLAGSMVWLLGRRRG